MSRVDWLRLVLAPFVLAWELTKFAALLLFHAFLRVRHSVLLRSSRLRAVCLVEAQIWTRWGRGVALMLWTRCVLTPLLWLVEGRHVEDR
jgi:hypothetical protein